jgi:hypothetical protein
MVVRVQACRESSQDPIGTNESSLSREVMRFELLLETLGGTLKRESKELEIVKREAKSTE